MINYVEAIHDLARIFLPSMIVLKVRDKNRVTTLVGVKSFVEAATRASFCSKPMLSSFVDGTSKDFLLAGTSMGVIARVLLILEASNLFGALCASKPGYLSRASLAIGASMSTCIDLHCGGRMSSA